MRPTTKKGAEMTQLNVWIDKDTRRDLNTIYLESDSATIAHAVALALRIAAKHYTDQGKTSKRKDAR